jgi:ABC-type sugar transport system permease subunit
MYTIIGGDGREYGPVSAEQVRQWIGTGRANGQTQVKAAGSEDWKPLAEFAEFNQAGPVVAAATAPGAPAQFDPIDCFSRSWRLLLGNFWPFVGATLLPIVVSAALSLGLSHSGLQPEIDREHPFKIFQGIYFPLSVLLPLLINPPLSAGVLYFILKRARGDAAGMNDVLSGYTRAYGSLVLAPIVGLILVFLGLACLILPGIYLAVAYSFAQLAIIDRRCGVWAGLELSRRAISRHWWACFLMGIISLVVLLVGVVALGVGVFVALPLVYGAMVYAYLDLTPPVIASAP